MALYQRSLSDSLLLEDNVSGEYTDLHFLEGEDIVGASDQLELKRNKQKKNEAVDILKLINNDKEFSKHGLKSSRSLENLDMKAPVEVWKDSYDRLYNAKVKRFLKGSQVAKDKRHSKHGSGQETTETLDRKSKVNIATLLQNADRMCLAPSETEFDEKTRSSISHYDPRDSTGDLMRAKLKTNTARDFSSLQSKVNLTNVEHEINLRGGTYTDLEKDVGFNTPDRTLSHGQVSPVMHLTKGHFKTPKAVLNSPDMNMDVPSDNVEKSKFKLPKFSFSGNNNPDIKYDASMKGSPAEVAAGLNGPNIKIDGPKVDYKGLKTDLDMDMPSGKPKTALSGPKMMTSEMDVSTSKFIADCNSPDIKIRGQKPGMDVDLPKGNIKASNLKPPYLDLNASDLIVKAPSGPNLKIKSSDLNFKNSNVNEGINDPGMDLTLPHADLKNPNDFGLTGPKIQTPNYDLKTPEMDLSTPKLKTGLDSTDINIKCQKPDITDTNIDLSKGKITVPNLKTPSHDFNAHDLDINAPSGKIKMPKLKIFGNKPEGSSLKIKSSDLNLKTPKIKGGIDTPELNLTQPQTDLKAPNMDIKSPDASKLKMPRPHMNVDANIEQHDLDLSALTPKLNAGIKSPHIDINGPIADIKGPKTDLTLPNMDMPLEKKKMPTFKMPDFGLSAPNIRTLDADLKTPQMNLSAPKFKGDFNSPDLSISGHKPDITAPDMNGDFSKGKIKGTNLKNPNFDMDTPDFKMNSPSSKLKLQKFGISGSKKKGPDLKIKSPNLNIKSPKMKGGIDTPDMDPTLPQVNLKAPNLDLKSPDIDLKDPSGKFKMPSLGLPGLKEPHINVDAGIDQPDLNVSPLTPKLNAGINGPDIDIHGPHADFKGLKTDLKLPDMDMPSGKKKMPNFKMPSFGLTGPKLKTPDYDLKTPDMDLFPPKFKADFDSPDINLGHNIDVTAPNLNVDLPKGKIKGPDLKTPDLDMNAPDFDINAPSGKMKLPKFGLSGKPKGPDFKINSPKLNLKSPKIKGGIDTPDMDMTLPQADFKSPNLDLKSPDIDLNGPSGKLNMAKPKMPSLNLSGLKGSHMNADVNHPDLNLTASTPKLNAGISGPDIDIHGAGLKGPQTDFTLPDMDMPSGKMKLPNLKFPKFSLSGSKLKTPDYDLKTPEMDLSTPKFKADFDSPDINLGHNIDVTAPNMNVDLPKGKIKGPDLKTPDLDMNAPSGKLKLPKFGFFGKPKGPDFKINSPKLNLKSPKIKGGIDTPDMDLTLRQADFKSPNLDLKSPDIDLNGPSGKLNMAKPKMPSLNMSGLKGPHMNADVDHPDLNLTASTPKLNAGMSSPDIDIHGPGLKGPKTDLTVPDMDMPSGKMKLPNLKFPKLGLSGPKLKTPDYDLKTPEMDLSAPKFKADFDSPDLNLDNNLHVTAPDMNVDLPKGQMKALDLKKPNLDMRMPTGKINMPTLKMPKFGVSGTKIKTPDYDLKTPEMDLSAPEFKADLDTTDINIKGNKPDITGPDMDFDIPKGTFKGPNLKTPNFNMSAPDLDINAPSGKMKLPKFGKPKGTNFKMTYPKLTFKNPQNKGGIDIPQTDFKSPNLDADLDHPGLNLSASTPKLNAGINSPDMNVHGFNADHKGMTTDLTPPDINMPSGKMKLPNLKMPKFGLSGPKLKTPEYDLKNPEIGLSAPKADFDSPEFNIKGQKPEISGPDMDVNIPKNKFKGPSFKKPNIDMNAPDLDINSPSGKLKLPKFSLSGSKPKSPEFKVESQNLNLKTPQIKGGIDTPDMDLNLLQAKMKTPKLDLKSPDVDLNDPSGKFNMAKPKMPSLNSPGLKGPHMDADIDHPDLNLSASSKLNAGVKSPHIDIDGPNADFKVPKTDLTLPNMDMPSSKKKMPNFKIPDVGFTGPKINMPDYDKPAKINLSAATFKADLDSPDINFRGHKPDITAPDMNVNVPKSKINVPNFKKPNVDSNTPEIDIDAPSAKMKLPKIGLSDLKAEGPDFKMKSPKLKTKSPKINGGIDTPGMDLTLPQTDLKTSNLDFRPPDIDVNGPSGKFNMSKLKMPSLGLSGLKEPHFDDDIDHPDIRLSSSPPKLNAGTNHPDFNIHGPNGDFTLPKTEMPSGKIKTSTFKMPDIGFSGQKIKTPDYDLKAPNLDLFNSPDLSTRSHKPDFRVPDKNVDFPKGKIKATNFKPNLDVYTPELDNPDFQGLGSNDDFHDYTKMHANNFAIPRGNIKAGKTYDLDPSLRDIRMPNHQKYGTSKFTMQDPYFDLNSGMNISGKAQRPKMTRHLPDSPDVTMALPTPRPRTSGVVPTSSDVYYSEMSGAHRSRDHKRTGSNFEIDDSWNKISVPKLQAPTRTENLPVRNSNMGMSPKQISPHRGGDARYYRKTQMVPRRHYTTDDICYTYKGMPRRDGRGNEQSDYSRRRTMRHLQIQAMDLEVPESTLKGSKMNVLKLM